MDQKHWQVEKQPCWLVAAAKKTITQLPGGYQEAADWVGATENALFNRLRADGDQIFPFGWLMVLQRAGGSHHIAHAVARASGGYFIPGSEIGEVDNEDINMKLIEAFEQVSRYSERFRESVKDGVMDNEEFEQLKDDLYLATVKLQEHLNLGSRVYSEPEKANAPGCSPERSVAIDIQRGERGDKSA